MGEFVRVERDDAIATIRLDRPPMNALNAQVQDEIAAAAAEVDTDPAVRAVVLYGGGKVGVRAGRVGLVGERRERQRAFDRDDRGDLEQLAMRRKQALTDLAHA